MGRRVLEFKPDTGRLVFKTETTAAAPHEDQRTMMQDFSMIMAKYREAPLARPNADGLEPRMVTTATTGTPPVPCLRADAAILAAGAVPALGKPGLRVGPGGRAQPAGPLKTDQTCAIVEERGAGRPGRDPGMAMLIAAQCGV
jgi:hypothetical protein